MPSSPLASPGERGILREKRGSTCRSQDSSFARRSAHPPAPSPRAAPASSPHELRGKPNIQSNPGTLDSHKTREAKQPDRNQQRRTGRPLSVPGGTRLMLDAELARTPRGAVGRSSVAAVRHAAGSLLAHHAGLLVPRAVQGNKLVSRSVARRHPIHGLGRTTRLYPQRRVSTPSGEARGGTGSGGNLSTVRSWPPVDHDPRPDCHDARLSTIDPSPKTQRRVFCHDTRPHGPGKGVLLEPAGSDWHSKIPRGLETRPRESPRGKTSPGGHTTRIIIPA